ncbi:MAG: carbohydrate ABC transporter permease, partial [Candidatus Gallimonas sp.]
FDSGFPIMSGMLNSFIIAMSSTVLCVYFSMLTAYGFVAYEFKAKKQLYGVILASMVVPSQLGMIGWYQLVVDLGMYNTWIPLILPSIAAPTTVFFLKQYLETSYSRDIVEAARIDGSGEFHTFNSIILPISVPALATMAIFSFVYSWNNYLGPIMILNSEELYTLPMLVQMLKTNIYATDYGLVYAGILLTILPLLIVYLAFSRFIIGGVAIGGVKE